MPELNLPVSERVFGKIKALSRISNLNSEQVTQLLGDSIDKQLDDHIIYHTQKMLESIGVPTSMLGNGYVHAPNVRQAPPELSSQEIHTQLQDDTDSISIGSHLGASEEEFKNMDDELPQDTFVMPNNNDDEDEEEDRPMPVKDKDGKPAAYENDYMNDLQQEVEDDEFGDDPAIAAADGHVNDSEDDTFADDTPRESSTPDVLPMDYGLDSVVKNDQSAASFFTAAIEGKQGDKTKRNGIKRKRIQS